MEGIIIVFGILAIIILIAYNIHATSSRKEIIDEYETSLQKLRDNPNNKEYLAEAIANGRNAIEAPKLKGDDNPRESDIAHDIEKIIGRNPFIVEEEKHASKTTEEKLNELNNLLEKGLITQEEYDHKRKTILLNI